MLKLYHGSNVIIDRIDLSFSKKGKDFGRGFYLNPSRKQAMDMAVRTTRRLMEGTPVVNAFWFDERLLQSDSPLKVKTFTGYSIEWLEFILQNRGYQGDGAVHPFDIVTGPIADDTVGLQIQRYMQGYINKERMIDELKFHEPAVQYFFGTERAIDCLKRTDDE